MSSLTVLADVADLDRPGFRRSVLLSENSQALVVASRAEGSLVAEHELTVELSEALRIAQAGLAGDRRALTTPGLARKLCATVAVLFRVAVTAGALITAEGFDDGHNDDRGEAADDEPAGD